MSTLISAANGNFTSAGSWGLVDATSYLDSEAATVALSTSNTDSQVFTPGAITVDGVAIKLQARAASPTGTITVTLRNNTGGSDVASVTANVSDLPVAGNGWVFFKFSSSQLLLAATDYLIRAATSSNGQVTVYRNGTAANMSRLLRTTTTQAPASGDQLVFCGALTGAGSLTTITITMDNTATTSFGSTVSGGPPQGVVVSLGGVVTWSTAASTALYFKWKGIMLVAGGGTVNVGTSGGRIDATSTAILECDSATTLDTGIQVLGGTFRTYGAAKTNMWTKLTADASAGATSLTLASTSGWAANDVLGIASTTQTYSQTEKRIINSVTSGTAVSLTVATTNAHGGNATTGVQGEVVNLTQNVVFRGVSASLCGYFYCASLAVVDINNCEFTQWGGNATNKHGLTPAGSSTSASFRYVSVHDCNGNSQYVFDLTSGTASSASWLTIQHVVSYNVDLYGIYAAVSGVLGASPTIDDCVFMLNGALAMVWFQLTDGCSIGSIRVIATNGLAAGYGVRFISPCTITLAGLVVHSCGERGVSIEGASIQVAVTGAGDTAVWRNANNGVYIENELGSTTGGVPVVPAVAFTNLQCFGNIGTGFYIVRGVNAYNYIVLTGCVFNGGSTVVMDYGIRYGGIGTGLSAPDSLFLYSCQIGQTTGFGVAGTTLAGISQVIANNTLFSAVPVITGTAYGAYLKAQHYSAGPNDNRTFYWNGTAQTDSVIYRTAAPSERLTPNTNSSTTYKLQSGDKAIPVGSGKAATVTVYVRTSVVGDGQAYSGAAPRLMLRQNNAAGVTSLTVLGTLSGGSGSFAAISGVTPTALEDCTMHVYVDCNGTAGWVNVDDWSAVVA